MRNKSTLVAKERGKVAPLSRMVGKKVRVLTDGEWVGPVISVLDHENFLILKNRKTVRVNIFDIRSL